MANTDDDNRMNQDRHDDFPDYQKMIHDAMADAELKKQQAMADAEAKTQEAMAEAERRRQAAWADIERRRHEAETARKKSLEAAQKIREENEKALREGKELTEKAVEYGNKYSRYYAKRGMDILRDGYRMMWQEVRDSFHDNRERAEEKRTSSARKELTDASAGRTGISANEPENRTENAPDIRHAGEAAADIREVVSKEKTTDAANGAHQYKATGRLKQPEACISVDEVTQQKSSRAAAGSLEQGIATAKGPETKQKTEAAFHTKAGQQDTGSVNNRDKTTTAHRSHGRAVTHSGPENTILLANYFALVAIVPAFLSVMAYELVSWSLSYVIHYGTFEPLSGLGMIIPMTMLTEFFMYFLAKSLSRRLGIIQNAMHQVAGGNYSVRLDSEALQPFTEIADSFNTMAEELGSVETLRDDFINDFSHEFKTPIASINGFAKLLLEEDVDPEDRQEYLQIIADESGRLAELASNTLMMNKLDNYSSIPNQEDYSLDEQIRQNVVLLSPQWDKKHIQMEVDLEPLTYHGNPDLMSQVWINILNNAIKFTPEQGTIAVRLQVRDNNVYISISDTGQGMSEEDCKRIFQKYYQADSSHASKGMGLGLSIAHRIVELCGGEIQVDSIQDVGSTFTVQLPLDQ